MPEPSELAKLAHKAGTTFILALFVDLNGKPCAKLVPVEAVEQLATEGVGFAGYAVGALGQEPKDPDVMAVPDVSSFTPIPFVKEGLALVHCDPHVEGKPWPFAPRVILKSMIARLAEAGFQSWVGAEVEYFLLRRDANGQLVPADAHDTAAQPCYDARGVTRMFDHLAAVSQAMNTLGWGNYANDHEDGNGQFEQNFEYSDALTTADRVVTLRYLLNVIAHERDMIATFMAKPFSNRTGSGLHLHVSLTRGEERVFSDGTGEVSELARSFVAGVLDHACALQGLIAPTVNSYKRTGGVASSASGATWAPKSPTYGGNDRTHYIRIPDDTRIEIRGGDGSANPYLAVAGVLAAGLEGVAKSLPLGPLGSGPEDVFPPTLLHAAELLEKDSVLVDLLNGASPEGEHDVAGYLVNLKKDEFFTWHAQVSPWEHERYLTAI
jgi:glutamine synthetase